MVQLLELMFSGFWSFMGFLIFFMVIFQSIYSMFTAPMKRANIKEHGYPPSHCDSLGNLKSDEKIKEEDNNNKMRM